MTALEDAFRQEERLLWGLGYRMTGLASDADELVQETFLKALEHPPQEDRPLRPWLVHVCANLARDRLRARRRRADPAVWLPSPIPTPDEPESGEARYTRAESVSIAFLLALETLTPGQRAVLLLRDVFDLSAEETAAALDMAPGAVRATHLRARRAIAGYDEGRAPPDPARAAATLEALHGFLGRLAKGDAPGALAFLAPDVEMHNDGGGVYRAARMPVIGAEKVLKFLLSVAVDPARVRWALRELNALPSVVMELVDPDPRQAPRMVFTLALDRAGRITRIFWVLDPKKLGAV